VSLFKRLFSKPTRKARFEDYKIKTGYTNVGHVPIASLEEFFALTGTGDTHEEAISQLKDEFYKRIDLMEQRGEPIPRPGSGKARARFADSDQVESLRPFIDEFWSEILGTSYLTSFVSNKSRLSSWEHYVSGGRPSLIRRVKEKYGVDISDFYDEAIPVVLRRIRDASTR
jgi:hypothetical protein